MATIGNVTQIGLSISDAVLLRRGVSGAAQGAPIPPSQQIPTRWNGLIDWTKESRSFLAKGAKSIRPFCPMVCLPLVGLVHVGGTTRHPVSQ